MKQRGATTKDISSLRSTLEYLEAVGELVSTDVEVDPHLEVAAIQKHFDGGAALLFNKVKGYPNARICNNLFANAEYVIEGYLDTTQKVWESPLAEKDDEQGKHPFHPEWSGYMGKAYRTYKFQATAVTHRADRPLYYGLIVHGMDEHFIDGVVREACFLELAERIVPGLCVDTHIPMGMTDWGGVIFQVKKRC